MSRPRIQVLTEGTVANNGITYLDPWLTLYRACGTHVFTLLIDTVRKCAAVAAVILPTGLPPASTENSAPAASLGFCPREFIRRDLQISYQLNVIRDAAFFLSSTGMRICK